MEELSCSKIIFDVKEGVKVGEELAKDMLAVFEELILLVQVGKENCFWIFRPSIVPLQVINDFGFRLCACLCGELNIIPEVNDIVIDCGSRVLILSQDSEVDLSVCENISPEDRQEVWDSSLRFQTLEGSLNVNSVDVPQEVSFIDGW